MWAQFRVRVCFWQGRAPNLQARIDDPSCDAPFEISRLEQALAVRRVADIAMMRCILRRKT